MKQFTKTKGTEKLNVYYFEVILSTYYFDE
jgi:hypothetical protein